MMMSRRLFCLVVLASCFVVTGCGSGNAAEAEKTTNDLITTMNALSASIESGDKSKVKELSGKYDELAKKVSAIKVTSSEKKKIDDKTKAEYEKANSKLFDAMSKAIASGKMTASELGAIEGKM